MMKPDDFEKLGVFYLGRELDPASGDLAEMPLLYDSRDLTTHAVCVGMTGSGKTGLGIALLEEAAIDGIPALIIDPKGDMGNLALNFPALSPADFRPWIDPQAAARQGIDVDTLADRTAELWRKGLAEWGQGPQRLQLLRDAAEVKIYTPGSDAGEPISVLRSFDPPEAEIINDASALRDHTNSTVGGLLGLLGITADPLRSREHILLASLLDHAWRQGRSLNLPELIAGIQKPPFQQVGVFDIESFYPAAQRLDLAMALNNLLAAPGFDIWLRGSPLDIQRLLFTTDGRPRLAVLTLAHLSDSERMFFVTLLLNAVISWMRRQPGTSSLRALLYMDEIFGYFPPTAMPASKQPMLTLLKQARAYGLGVVLATQNPVDLDYKGLSNTGTWFIGRLQTERDKMRVLDGMESAEGGGAFDRAQIDKLIAGLGNRTFLMRNVHQPRPLLFKSRWALSYLSGPMTAVQIKAVMPATVPEPPPAGAFPPAATPQPVAPATPVEPAPAAATPAAATPSVHQVAALTPQLPPAIAQFYLPATLGGGAPLLWRPRLLGRVKLHFVAARLGIDLWTNRILLGEVPADEAASPWRFPGVGAVERGGDLPRGAPAEGRFAPLPQVVSNIRNFAAWKRDLTAYAYEQIVLELFSCAMLKMVAKPGETEGDFRAAVNQVRRERRDLEVEKVRQRYASKLATAEGRVQSAAAKIDQQKGRFAQQKVQTAISFGAAIMGALMQKRATVGTVGRTATAMRGAGRLARDKGDVARAGESLEARKAQLEELQREIATALERTAEKFAADQIEINREMVRPRKTDIVADEVALIWTPWREMADGAVEAAYTWP